jgi:hypothetical protein
MNRIHLFFAAILIENEFFIQDGGTGNISIRFKALYFTFPLPSLCQNTHKSCLFSENNLKYLSIFDLHLEGHQGSSLGGSRP